MPNWVQNKIEFSGKDEDVKKVLELIQSKDENGEIIAIDFNKILPMPKALNIESSGDVQNGIIYYLSNKLELPFESIDAKYLSFCENSFNPNYAEEIYTKRLPEIIKSDNTKERLDKIWKLGKQAVENIDLYNFTDWYSWCCDNWGTKWNASDTEVSGNCVWFQTAWSCPEGIIQKLAEICVKYNVAFKGCFADEDAGSNSGEFSSRGGINYFETDSEAARETFVELWDYDPWSEEEEE